MILFVFEGRKREPNLFRAIESLFFKDRQHIVCSFDNNIYELYKKNPNNDRICQNLVTLCDMCIMEYVIADKWGASSVKSILDSLNNNKSAAFNRHKGKLAQSYSNIWNQLDINNRMLLMGRSVPGRSLNDKGWALKAGLDYYKKLGDVRSSSSSRLSGLAGLGLFDDFDLPF